MSPRGDVLLAVHVVGTPKPQGSKRAFYNPKAGRAQIVDANKRPLKDWRTDVVVGCQRAMDDTPLLLLGPLAVRLVFALPRPASAPRSRLWPAVKPDIDKLARAVLDAMTDAGVWKDDAQVVDLHPSKHYPGPDIGQHVPGVRITVYRVADPAAPSLPIERTTQTP